MAGVVLVVAISLGLYVASGCDGERRDPEPARGMSQADYDRWRRPDVLVAALALRPGQTVADVGAGSGYLTHRLAAAVGPTGRVVATDVDRAALARIAERGGAAGRAAIETRVVDPDHPDLEPTRYDLVLMAQVDHLLADRATYLERLRPALADGGRVAVSNRLQHRAGLLGAAVAAGYRVREERKDLPGQYLVILEPAREVSR